MKVGHISADDMRNGEQVKDTPGEGPPNTLTAEDIQARWLEARSRRQSDWRDFGGRV